MYPKSGEKLAQLTDHLHEIKELGANTLWLGPIYKSSQHGQGYDVVDHFSVNPDLGNHRDFARLMKRARELGLRVVLDFVPSHISAHHAAAKAVAKKGEASEFFSLFMHAPDGAPYGEHYQEVILGRTKFLTYFWKELLNLDLNGAKAQELVTNAALFWLKKFDIDGYRIDAAWAPMARSPNFMVSLRDRLKREKSTFAFIAEDKAGRPEAYGDSNDTATRHPASSEVFDVVYDWTRSAEYISEWSWTQHDQTIFDQDEGGNVAGLMREALETYRRDDSNRARVLRFIENNDTHRFISTHSLGQTKLAAWMTFLVPGVPLIYAGQEVGLGRDEEPHVQFPTYDPNKKIRYDDELKLWPFYQRLTRLRAELPELRSDEMAFLEVKPASQARKVLAFDRTLGTERTTVIANFGWSGAKVRVGQRNYRLKPYEVVLLKNGKRL